MILCPFLVLETTNTTTTKTQTQPLAFMFATQEMVFNSFYNNSVAAASLLCLKRTLPVRQRVEFYFAAVLPVRVSLRYDQELNHPKSKKRKKAGQKKTETRYVLYRNSSVALV